MRFFLKTACISKRAFLLDSNLCDTKIKQFILCRHSVCVLMLSKIKKIGKNIKSQYWFTDSTSICLHNNKYYIFNHLCENNKGTQLLKIIPLDADFEHPAT